MPPLPTTDETRCQDEPSGRRSLLLPFKSRFSLTRRRSSKPKVGVHFSSNVDVREVPSLKDMPIEEISASWYNADEFLVIKKTLVTTLKLMAAKKPLHGDLCQRGLEHRSTAGVNARKVLRVRALRAVWNEQVSQWKSGTTDAEAIRVVYQRETDTAQTQARRMGQMDEIEARSYQLNGGTAANLDFLGSSDCCGSTRGERSGHDRIREPVRAGVVPMAA